MNATTTEVIIDNSVGAMDEHSMDIWDHQITFEIPSNLDLEKIKHLDNFTTLLHRVGFDNTDMNFGDTYNNGGNIYNGHQSANSDGIQNIFGKWSDNVDYQIILNYLWIGVVTSLIIISMIFFIFSCYFYRKFKEWKKCNKDIRSQLQNDLYPTVEATEDGYYQMESPPCYTIATGLPSYDEALLQAHFTFGMRLLYSWESPTSDNNYYHQHWDRCTINADVKEIENFNHNSQEQHQQQQNQHHRHQHHQYHHNQRQQNSDSVNLEKTRRTSKDIDCTEVVVIS